MNEAGLNQAVGAAKPATRCLYVGGNGHDIAAVLAGPAVAISCEPRVAPALILAAAKPFDVAIVDQRGGRDDARSLLIAALAASRQPPRLIVLADTDDVRHFLGLPGVRYVLATPFRPQQLQRAVAVARPVTAQLPENILSIPANPPQEADKPQAELASPEARKRLAERPTLRHRLLSTGPFMATVSTLYKNAAFVLLATLFAAFVFYGLLIAYFLLASNWGAPVTLSTGHELVVKADREIADLQVAVNNNAQRIDEARLAAANAEHASADAALFVTYVKGTIEQEIATRDQAQKTLRDKTVRLEKVLAEFKGQAKSGAMPAVLTLLYRKHLIDKPHFDAGTLGLFDAKQRAAALQSDIDAAHDLDGQTSRAIDMLTSLRNQLDRGKMSGITAATADMMLLAKQAVDARAALDQATAQLTSARQSETSLASSLAVLKKQIAEREQSPFGRARSARVDVIFVPYGNDRNFAPGTALYSCALTIVFCHRAGTVGAALPGESNAIHPFFGKPLRGVFVEATIDDPAAAAKEIIHAGRPPLFF